MTALAGFAIGAVRMGAEVYQTLKGILRRKGYGTAVGDEGGFEPNLRGNAEAVELILEAIVDAGLRAGSDIVLALAPIRSIEDGVAQNDELGWRSLTKALGHRIQLVGDANLVTNPRLIRWAINEGVANAVVIKPNQVGTVTETFTAIKEAHAAAYGTVISHRSGETNDDFIADLAVATAAAQIKAGAPCRGERIAKYNQLLRIEEELGLGARYAGRECATRCLAQRNHDTLASGQTLLMNGAGLLGRAHELATG